MNRFSLDEAAERSGTSREYILELVTHGMVKPDDGGLLSQGDARRAASVFALTESGVTLDGLAAAIDSGEVSLDFLDNPVYERFAAVSDETFDQVSERTGVPMELLSAIWEALGSSPPSGGDRVRDQELKIVPFVQIVLSEGATAGGIERVLRVVSDSMRRIAETEADWYFKEILQARIARGLRGNDIEPENPQLVNELIDQAWVAIYHGQQARTWMTNVVRGIGGQLADAGLHETTERPPAICFLDITGYTRLTQEHGDAAAAELAEQLTRLVQRTSLQHGGRPIKWLGDGVMFHFPDPGAGVAAALEMVAGIAAAGLPPAHVGLHSGPVLFQEGDYFGQTVNMAARIGDFARPGEVLVSQEMVEATSRSDVAFAEIGPVELKGVAGPVRLYSARLAA